MSLVSKASYVVAAVAVALTLGVPSANPALAASSAHNPTPPLLASRGLHFVPAVTKKVNGRNIQFYWIANNGDGYCIDANSNGYPSDGDLLQLWACNTNPEQLWYYDVTTEQIHNSRTGYCIDARSEDYPSDGDRLQLWTCNENDEQLWGEPYTYPGAGNIPNAGVDGYCIDANSAHWPSDGDALQLWTCNSNPEQEWDLIPVS